MEEAGRWTEHWTEDGARYYHDREEGVSTWIRPSELPQRHSHGPVNHPSPDYAIHVDDLQQTAWRRVTTRRGYIFWRHLVKGLSIWGIPPEVDHAARQLQKKCLARDEQAKAAGKRRLIESEEEDEVDEDEAVAGSTKKRKIQNDEDLDEDLQEILREQTRLERESDVEDGESEQERETGEDPIPAPAEEEDPFSQLDEGERQNEFVSLLLETKINPLGSWEDESKNLRLDERFRAIKDSDTRRNLFEARCKDILKERKKSKEVVLEDPRSRFLHLLKEEVTSSRATFDDFVKIFGKDDRFVKFGKNQRDRRKVFDDHVADIAERKRQSEQEEESQFNALLAESRIVTPTSQWDEVKAIIKKDPRYKGVPSSSRERYFQQFILALDQRAQAEKERSDRKIRAKEALKIKEQELRRERARLDRKRHLAMGEATEEHDLRLLRALYVDSIHQHDTDWNTALAHLERDPRFHQSSLSTQRKRQLFEERLNTLRTKFIQTLYNLFDRGTIDEMGHGSLTVPFSQIWPLVKDSPEVKRVSSIEANINHLYDLYLAKKLDRVRQEFVGLMKEDKSVQYWGQQRALALSRVKHKSQVILSKAPRQDDEQYEDNPELNLNQDPDQGSGQVKFDLSEMHAILNTDSRYHALNHLPQEREEMMRRHLDSIEIGKMNLYQDD